MPPSGGPSRDRIRVLHICGAIEEALSFVSGKSRDDLTRSRMLTLSLIKEFEMIGEAASRISEPFRKQHSQIPWDALIATRNRLVHGYFDVDIGVIWNTIDGDLPRLLEKLKPLRPHDL
ncbi:MAG: DUF86 domain-containing protein [bacterium]|nr:DUF86 domain-containing protein [bacterium]